MLERQIASVPTGVPIVDNLTDSDAGMQQSRFSEVEKEFTQQALHPPGNDPYIRNCYVALTTLMQEPNEVTQLMTEVLERRQDIRPKHFVNLFFRGVQSIELFQRRNASYPHALQTPEAWTAELQDVIAQDGDTLREVLLTKDTTSTIYQRYAGAASIMTALLPRHGLAVADFGCGGNYGLPGIALKEPFKPLKKDDTPQHVVSQLLRHPPTIGEGLAIDRENPYDEAIRQWRLACSFYPQELGQLPDVVAMEERLSKVTNVAFHQGDLLALPTGTTEVPAHYFDAVIISTMCYQIPHAQDTILTTAARILKPDGIVIIQDFAEKDALHPDLLNFEVEWFKHPFSYRNFVTGPRTDWEMKEVLRWNNGRCEQVKPGEDFSLINPLLSQPAA